MPTKKYIPLPLPDHAALPAPLYFRYDEFGADTRSAPHSHPWGQLNYASHGVMQLDVGGQRFLSPPQYAVWVPPGVEHGCYNREAIVYRSLYVSAELSRQLPTGPCTLQIGDILKAILSDFAARGVNIPESAADKRLAQVVLDQLQASPRHEDYLPFAQSALLGELLAALQAEPGDNRSLADWARQVHSTERTLARMCQRELGMSFGEWRQRLRFLAAIEALEAGRGVQEIAFDLGYSSASAFIAMFRRQAGTTPEQYRVASRGLKGKTA
ncbi:helix-turn-helix transcriptional regulator [Pseudomonas citronellolis]|uniref:AraC family transcriptional regulator n=2 Tax=Pseudomonas TaxID=286 RepID=UPI00248DC426|nr:helix-turn-helix transcriptional regulator [Pseudomonas citronellolis]